MKKTILLFLAALLWATGYSQANSPADKIRTALLIVDIQQFYFPGEGPGLSGVVKAGEAAGEVLKIFRQEKLQVVHMRHKSARGFEFHPTVLPETNEKVFTKEEVNSFYRTGLQEYLSSKGINRLVIIGMQTHMCLEAAVRAAHDLGYEVFVVPEACATKDLTFGGNTVKAADVQTAVLATLSIGHYGKIISLDNLKSNIAKYLYQAAE